MTEFLQIAWLAVAAYAIFCALRMVRDVLILHQLKVFYGWIVLITIWSMAVELGVMVFAIYIAGRIG